MVGLNNNLVYVFKISLTLKHILDLVRRCGWEWTTFWSLEEQPIFIIVANFLYRVIKQKVSSGHQILAALFPATTCFYNRQLQLHPATSVTSICHSPIFHLTLSLGNAERVLISGWDSPHELFEIRIALTFVLAGKPRQGLLQHNCRIILYSLSRSNTQMLLYWASINSHLEQYSSLLLEIIPIH